MVSYRHLLHDVLKISPNEVLLGCTLRPANILLAPGMLDLTLTRLESPSPSSARAFYVCAEGRQTKITAATFQRQQTAIKRFAIKVQPLELKVGVYVYLYDNEKAKQKHKKLEP